MSNLFVTPLVLAVLVLIALKFSSSIEQKAYDESNNLTADNVFKVANWVFMINVLFIPLVVLFVGGAYDLIKKNSVDIFAISLLLIGVLFLFIGFYGFYLGSKMYISIKDGVLTYFNGKKKK